MKRWCRLSALQAKHQALGHVHTWHCGASASASATAVPLPTSLPKASSVCTLDLTCAALEPRPTHHPPLMSSSPSAHSTAFAETVPLAHIPPGPSEPALTLTLTAFGRRCQLIVKLTEPKLFVM